MNCLDYRRQLGSDPRRESAPMQAHRRECAGCAAHHARTLGFELALRRALAVPVPAGLTERILLAQTTQARGSRGLHRRQRRWLAVAAAVLLAATLGVFQLKWFAPLPAQLVAHLSHEPEALLTHVALPDAEVRQRFQERGVALVGNLPAGISYVQTCPVGLMGTVHLVMSEREGPLTVFYIPGRNATRGDYRQGNMHVRALPVAGGTLALVAMDPRHFDVQERNWRQALERPADFAVGAL